MIYKYNYYLVIFSRALNSMVSHHYHHHPPHKHRQLKMIFHHFIQPKNGKLQKQAEEMVWKRLFSAKYDS